MCVCVCVCVCIYIYIYIYIHTHTYTNIQTKDLLEIIKDELRYGINNANSIQHHNELVNTCRTKFNRITLMHQYKLHANRVIIDGSTHISNIRRNNTINVLIVYNTVYDDISGKSGILIT